MNAANPAIAQYAANGVSFFVLKYFVRKRTDKNAAIAAAIAPTKIGPITSAWNEDASSGSLRTAAAKIIGVAIRNEKRAAFS